MDEETQNISRPKHCGSFKTFKHPCTVWKVKSCFLSYEKLPLPLVHVLHRLCRSMQHSTCCILLPWHIHCSTALKFSCFAGKASWCRMLPSETPGMPSRQPSPDALRRTNGFHELKMLRFEAAPHNIATNPSFVKHLSKQTSRYLNIALRVRQASPSGNTGQPWNHSEAGITVFLFCWPFFFFWLPWPKQPTHKQQPTVWMLWMCTAWFVTRFWWGNPASFIWMCSSSSPGRFGE